MAFANAFDSRCAGFLLATLAVLGACGGGSPDLTGGPAASGSPAVSGSAGTPGTAGASGRAAGGVSASSNGGAAGGGALSTGGSGGSVPAQGGLGGGGSAGNGGSAGQPAALTGTGTIGYERWDGVKGEAVELVPVNDTPTVTLELQAFQMPDDVGQDFGARLRGFLTAPATGDYTFWLSCDDNGELSLSSDESPAGKQRIAYVNGSPAWTDYVEWDKFPTQRSAVVPLVAGKRYYVEALLKEDIAEDHLAVGWLKPGQSGTLPSEIIPGEQLSPFAAVP